MSEFQPLVGNQKPQNHRTIEIRLLLSAINMRYGYDFTDYQEGRKDARYENSQAEKSWRSGISRQKRIGIKSDKHWI